MTVECTSRVQVRWGDVDAAGIVFYPRFYEWYDYGCEALFASLGFPWPETFPRYGIVGVPILESGSRFPSPVKSTNVGDSLSTVEGRLCAAGFEVRAWVKRPTTPAERLQAVPIPDEVVRRLRGEPT